MNKNKIYLMITMLMLLITITSIHFETLSGALNEYKIGIATRFNLLNESSLNTENVENDTIGRTKVIKKHEILLWNKMFGDEYFYFGKTEDHFANCDSKYKNCRLTRSRESLKNYGAVLFHGNELNRDDLPEERDDRQYYVFVNLESPINRPIVDPYFEDYFNLTMTYRLDSDIPWPYKIMRNIKTGEMVAPRDKVEWMKPNFGEVEKNKEVNLIGSKMKLAAWLVSNCKTYGKREYFVDELRKYIKVDVIGRCAEPNAEVKCSKSKNCFEQTIENNYYFYLAFENSLCQDYVTEKFLNALRYNIVPVVYGGGNYSLFAPPYSYIDALDFESPKKLAEFLIKLSNNPEEYSKYFWWKNFYTIDTPKSWTLCKLCELLNENDVVENYIFDPKKKKKKKMEKNYSPLSNWYSKNKCPMQNALHDNHFATKDLRSRVLDKLITP